uniref:Uncharacterized protein n=1 Tax=Arundo donax TaxID=35708 RepID=A0A0A9EE52_ARUDO
MLPSRLMQRRDLKVNLSTRRRELCMTLIVMKKILYLCPRTLFFVKNLLNFLRATPLWKEKSMSRKSARRLSCKSLRAPILRGITKN